MKSVSFPGRRAIGRRIVSIAVISAAVGALVASPASAIGACPNEALRSENGSLALPDCRAYERVSPATKNGAEFISSAVGGLADGPRLVFESLATFGGSEFANILGITTEFERSPAGWLPHPLGPPASQFAGIDELTPFYSPGEEGKSLLGLRTRGTPVDGESLYLRQGANLTEIGPEAPLSSLAGDIQETGTTDLNQFYFQFKVATPDISHVVFELFSPNYLWPFDQTGEFLPSTYEYAGTGNSQPFLVGVSGGMGSTALIGGCGTSVGSLFNEDTYNAISRDGSTVFFTPWSEEIIGSSCGSPVAPTAHSELYARVAGEKPSAHTVAVSEPSPADCSACQTEESETELKAATFQGASEDGSKVFFLTEQELLPGNPGMNLYEYDFDGPAGAKVTAVSHLPSEAAAGVLGVVRVSEDGSHVYFVASADLTGEPNSTGNSPVPGQPNLFVYDTETGVTKFVATLAPADSAVWSPQDQKRQAEATPDGRFLLFASTAELTPDDASSASQLFRYDASTGQLLRVSVGQNGFNDDGNTDVDPVVIPRTVDKYAFAQNSPPQKWMSDDGSFIFFESSKGLTPQALDHVELPNHAGLFAQNVYEWHEGQVSLLSDGHDRTYVGRQIVSEQRSSVHLIGTDSGGQDVLFTTRSPLVPGDTDAAQDIYDARIDGGFSQRREFPCTGDNCQGPLTSSPAAGQAGSSFFTGPENPKQKHKKHHRKKHHKRKHHKHRKKNGNKSRRAAR